MPAIYVDLDDVLGETGRMFLRVLADAFGRSVEFDAMRSYHLGESLGLGPEDLRRFLDATHEPEALAAIEPMDGAAEVLADWLRRGYEVLVITGRPPDTREATLDWLHHRGIPYSRFYFLDKYSKFYAGAHGTPDGVLGLADLADLDLCFAVEDFPGTSEYLARSLSVPVALFDRPWNGDFAAGGGRVVRCRDWDEVRGSFDSLLRP